MSSPEPPPRPIAFLTEPQSDYAAMQAASKDPHARALALIRQKAMAEREAFEAAGGSPKDFPPVWHPAGVPPGADLEVVTRFHRHQATEAEHAHLFDLARQWQAREFAKHGPDVQWSEYCANPFGGTIRDEYDDSD
ncbi:hypothetical protein WKW79_13670 [Variovorax robiniae]|uniref:Uncharacterized protein n=1 Tax=Variovorax robiniae TaxID=1836199 RepID=A0ABU8X7F9_9BURK